MTTDKIYNTALAYASYNNYESKVDDVLIELMLKDIRLLCSEYGVDFKQTTKKINEEGKNNDR